MSSLLQGDEEEKGMLVTPLLLGLGLRVLLEPSPSTFLLLQHESPSPH